MGNWLPKPAPPASTASTVPPAQTEAPGFPVPEAAVPPDVHALRRAIAELAARIREFEGRAAP